MTRLDTLAECHPELSVRRAFEPTPGLGRARNAGIAMSRGEIIVFTDDDCHPRPNYLDAVLDVFDEHDIAYLGGRIVLHDPGDAMVTVQRCPYIRWIPPRSYIKTGTIQGANLAMRRGILEKLGGFDPRLGAGTPFSCEDIDLVARASAAGHSGGYFPGPEVAHHHGRRSSDEVTALLRTYARGRGTYFALLFLRSETRWRTLLPWGTHLCTSPWQSLLDEVRGAWAWWRTYGRS